MEYYPITIVGAGNLAWSLAPALENAGHTLVEIYSQSLPNAESLASCLYDSKATNSLNFENSTAIVFIVAVPDDIIADVAKQIVLPADALVVHTSGSRPMEVLDYAEGLPGVFYPLQTFSKAKKADFSNIPICLECEDMVGLQMLENIALSLSNKVYTISSEERAVLHVAAVFANNFANHMFTLASDILNSEDLAFDMLGPLIQETAQKAIELGPAQAQTGPAIRHDRKTINSHIED